MYIYTRPLGLPLSSYWWKCPTPLLDKQWRDKLFTGYLSNIESESCSYAFANSIYIFQVYSVGVEGEQFKLCAFDDI